MVVALAQVGKPRLGGERSPTEAQRAVGPRPSWWWEDHLAQAPSLPRQAQPLHFLNNLLGRDGLCGDTEAPDPALSTVREKGPIRSPA